MLQYFQIFINLCLFRGKAQDMPRSEALLLITALAAILSSAINAIPNAGILRGAGDTTPVFWANVGGHYLVGLPVGLGLAYGLGLGPVGLWWGLSTGLALVALTLALRFHRISRRPILRS